MPLGLEADSGSVPLENVPKVNEPCRCSSNWSSSPPSIPCSLAERAAAEFDAFRFVQPMIAGHPWRRHGRAPGG